MFAMVRWLEGWHQVAYERAQPIALSFFGSLIWLLFCGPAAAEQILSRADIDLSDGNRPQLYLQEVTPTNPLSVTAPERVNAVLPADGQVWGAEVTGRDRLVVYGAFSASDASFDDLFVVDLLNPGVAARLNPVRSNNTLAPFAFGAQRGGNRVVYNLRNPATATDQLFLADARRPGVAELIAGNFLAGAEISGIQLAPDGRSAVYLLRLQSGEVQLWLSYLALPANAVRIDQPLTPAARPAEVVFTPDSRRVLWRARRPSSETEPLFTVLIDSVARTHSSAQVVNGQLLANERVFEFEVEPLTGQRVAYRAVSAGASTPGEVFVVDLDNPGVATRLNSAPVAAARFTAWEDIGWLGSEVIYNSAEVNGELSELYRVPADASQSSTLLSTNIPLSPMSGSNFVAGVSHFLVSQNQTRIALVDGDPAVGLYSLDPSNPGVVTAPVSLMTSESIGAPNDPLDPRGLPAQSLVNFGMSAGGELLAVLVDTLNAAGAVTSRNLQVANTSVGGSNSALFAGVANKEAFGHTWLGVNDLEPSEATLVAAAVLPSSRSGTAGDMVTAFATIINAGSVTAQDCSIGLLESVQARLDYQTTNPVTNELTGTRNAPVNIAPGTAQSFVMFVSLDGVFAPLDSGLAFECANAPPAGTLVGTNTLLLSSSAQPVADIVALAATASGDGIVRLTNGVGAFSVATVNVGTGANISVIAESAVNVLPVTIAICQTNPLTGACINPATPLTDPVTLTIEGGGTPTFSVFVSESSPVGADAAGNRIRVVFRDNNGAIRGRTSVAVQSQ